MKTTDYAPRSAPMDEHIKQSGTVGAEVGCDVGAHAHALLKYCNVGLVYCIDIWPNEFCRGYCEGRLMTAGYMNRFRMMHMESRQASGHFKNNSLDFVYIDIAHDTKSVEQSLIDWWPLLKTGGVLAYRNYSESNMELKMAVDKFAQSIKISKTIVDNYHNEIILFK